MDRRYQIGDRVLVRPDLKSGERYFTDDGTYSDGVALNMVDFAGKYVTIADYFSHGYLIEEDYKQYSWIDGEFIDERTIVAIDVSEYL